MNALDHMEVWRTTERAMAEEAARCGTNIDRSGPYRALSAFASSMADGYKAKARKTMKGVDEVDANVAIGSSILSDQSGNESQERAENNA